MAYVPVPKDLNAVKTKVLLNLTKRQLVCFGAGAVLGVPLFFLLKAHTGVSTAAICMILLMLPFFLLAMYEKNGQPLEKIVRNIVQVCFLRPKQRPYATNNFSCRSGTAGQFRPGGVSHCPPAQNSPAPNAGRSRPPSQERSGRIRNASPRRTASRFSGCSATASAA